MELVVLGTGGGWARPGGAACGYLLRHEGFTLWLDAGTGTMANLQRHARLEEVDAVVVSHRHFDHFLDLYPFYLSRWLDPDGPPPIPLVAPPGMFEHALQLEPELERAFSVRAVEPGGSFTLGPFRVLTAPMAHPVPTLGMRIEADGRVAAYSADTGPTDRLVELARGADLLLCEATWLERPLEWAPIHLTAEEAAAHAARAGVGKLVLTHVWPEFDPAESARRAARGFDGPVVVAVEGMVVQP